MLLVKLESVTNPDNWIPKEISPLTVPVKDLGEARHIAQKFIDNNNLGGGNFIPAVVMDRKTEKVIATISYNGTIWPLHPTSKHSDEPAPITVDENGMIEYVWFACEDCGCEDVKVDAYVQWNPFSKQWEWSGDLFFEDSWCDTCQERCTAIQKTAKSPWQQFFNDLTGTVLFKMPWAEITKEVV